MCITLLHRFQCKMELTNCLIISINMFYLGGPSCSSELQIEVYTCKHVKGNTTPRDSLILTHRYCMLSTPLLCCDKTLSISAPGKGSPLLSPLSLLLPVVCVPTVLLSCIHSSRHITGTIMTFSCGDKDYCSKYWWGFTTSHALLSHCCSQMKLFFNANNRQAISL